MLLCWLPGYTQLCNAVLLLKSSPAITYAVWNPSDRGAGIALSVSDLDATCAGTSSVRATLPIRMPTRDILKYRLPALAPTW